MKSVVDRVLSTAQLVHVMVSLCVYLNNCVYVCVCVCVCVFGVLGVLLCVC